MFSVLLSHSSTLWKNLKPRTAGAVLPLLKQEILGLQMNLQVRPFAARRGKRVALLAAKREKKMAEAAKPVAPKYLPKKTDKKSSLKALHRIVDENWLEANILDDIWRLKLCRGKPYPFTDAITMLQEVHDQTQLNDPEAFVYASVELDLHLKKNNKFMDEFSGTVLYPHLFETGTTNRVIAICENADDEFKASTAGAFYAGGKSLIERVKCGEITSHDFDYLVCHHSMLKEIAKLRGILKNKFPSMKNGLLTTNVELRVSEFVRCIEYSSNASTVEPDFGWVDVCFGRLNMSHKDLEENLKTLLNNLEEKHKPIGVENRLFITRTLLWCSKSNEKFKIPHWEYLPGYPENGVIASSEDSVEDEDIADVRT